MSNFILKQRSITQLYKFLNYSPRLTFFKNSSLKFGHNNNDAQYGFSKINSSSNMKILKVSKRYSKLSNLSYCFKKYSICSTNSFINKCKTSQKEQSLINLSSSTLCKNSFSTSSIINSEAVSSEHCHHHDVSKKDSLHCLSEDEIHLKESARRFSIEKILPLVREMDEKAYMPLSIISELFDHGFMSVEVNEEYGGSGCSFFSSLLVIEEIAKVEMGVSLIVDLQNTLFTNLIQQLGTVDQKNKFLPRFCTDLVGAFCLSEEQSGSDAFALKTTATKDCSNYILNGSKMWISNAAQAGVFFVMANAKPEDGYKGITCFIVDRNTPGLTVGKKEDKLGIRSTSTCPVHFDHVKVSEENILGELGKGYKYSISLLNGGRIGIAAQLVGVAQGCLDHTIPYLLTRKQFGQKIFNFQGLQHQVAQLSTRLEAARLLTYNAGRRKVKGMSYLKEAAMAKYYASEVACEITSRCIDWAGGVGITKTFPIEKYYRDCKVGTIYEGTSNIQLNTIAKSIKQDYESKN